MARVSAKYLYKYNTCARLLEDLEKLTKHMQDHGA